MENNNNYDDIIDLEYVKSKRHPHMSRLDRAAQFAPFAAVLGREDAFYDNDNEKSDK